MWINYIGNLLREVVMVVASEISLDETLHLTCRSDLPLSWSIEADAARLTSWSLQWVSLIIHHIGLVAAGF